MTDIRDINSTRQTTQDVEGRSIITVRDSLLSEILLSVIMGITLLSCMVVLKSYIDIIDVSMYMQFVPLILSVVHVLIRRTTIKSQLIIFLLHIAADVVFFFIVTFIPYLQYGNSLANRFYLAAIITVFTLFSLFYRLKPTFTAADGEFIVFPAIIHIVFYLLYAIARQDKYASNIVTHAIIIAVLFIIMRQIAVFDAKFYHSMHKSSKPMALLKKQNNRTIAGLMCVIVVSLVVLALFPVDWISSMLLFGIKTVFGFFSFIFERMAPQDSDSVIIKDPFEDMEFPEATGENNPLFDFFGKVLAIIILIIVIILILNAIRILIQNAPRFAKKKEVAEDDVLTDTVEDIKPEKRSLITKGPDFGAGNERRIRRQFYNKTRRAMKKGLPVSAASTPGQIENVLLQEGDKEISDLRQAYEEVRYGKH